MAKDQKTDCLAKGPFRQVVSLQLIMQCLMPRHLFKRMCPTKQALQSFLQKSISVKLGEFQLKWPPTRKQTAWPEAPSGKLCHCSSSCNDSWEGACSEGSAKKSKHFRRSCKKAFQLNLVIFSLNGQRPKIRLPGQGPPQASCVIAAHHAMPHAKVPVQKGLPKKGKHISRSCKKAFQLNLVIFS